MIVAFLARTFGGLHIPCKPRLTSEQIERVVAECKVNDVLLVRKRLKLSNVFIPGFWSHCGIVVGSHVIDATPPRVRAIPIAEMLAGYDDVCLCRPTFPAPEASLKAASAVGKPYDFEFEVGVNAFYCSELVTWALAPNGTWGHRNGTTLPEDFYKSSKFDKLITLRQHGG
jgi:uncharacterized protein YycO